MERLRTFSQHISHKRFLWSFIFALLLLLSSLVINFYAGSYANERESSAVTDIVLSNTNAINLDETFIYGSWALVAFIALICFREPWKIPFTVKSIALFVIIRALFITLTHIGPFGTPVVIDSTSFIRYFVFGADLFFSGHTGLPFLMALIYWDTLWLRITFIATSLFFGVVVLLAHLHYSIDVMSAFFITYSIYHLALTLFKKDREIFTLGIYA